MKRLWFRTCRIQQKITLLPAFALEQVRQWCKGHALWGVLQVKLQGVWHGVGVARSGRGMEWAWHEVGEMCCMMCSGIVFEELAGNDISYKIRLRHEVGNQDSWETDEVGPTFESPGPRISNRLVYCKYNM